MNKWQEIFIMDKESMIETMVRNIQSDLAAGYNIHGACIRAQREAIESYVAQFHAELDKLGEMTEAQAERWCYYNLKKRGVIS